MPHHFTYCEAIIYPRSNYCEIDTEGGESASVEKQKISLKFSFECTSAPVSVKPLERIRLQSIINNTHKSVYSEIVDKETHFFPKHAIKLLD